MGIKQITFVNFVIKILSRKRKSAQPKLRTKFTKNAKQSVRSAWRPYSFLFSQARISAASFSPQKMAS